MKAATTRTPQYSQAEKALYIAFELSRRTWKLGITVGFGQKARERNVKAGDLAGLQEEIRRARERFGLSRSVPVYSCYEAGRDGFWIHRALEEMGVQNVVVDPASIEVPRRKRRAKTDRIGAWELWRSLSKSCADHSSVWVESWHRSRIHASERFQELSRHTSGKASCGAPPNRPPADAEAVKEPACRSAWHEGQRGREAAGGEGHVTPALPESLGRCPERAHKLRVDLVEHLASRFRRRMDERRGGTGDGGGPGLRVLGQDCLDAKDAGARSLPRLGGFRIDLLDQVSHPLAVTFGGQMCPAGDRREHDGFGEDVLLAAELFTWTCKQNFYCNLKSEDDGQTIYFFLNGHDENMYIQMVSPGCWVSLYEA